MVTKNTIISCLIWDEGSKKSSISNPHVYCGKEHILTACYVLSDKSSSIDTRFINTCDAYSHIQATIKEIEVTDGTHEKGKILFKKDFTKNQKTSLLTYTSNDLTFFDRILYLSDSLSLM